MKNYLSDAGNPSFTSGLVLVLVATIVAGCGKEPVVEVPTGPRPIKMLAIGGEATTETLEVPGSVAAAQTSDLSFEVSGRMLARMVQEGQVVAAGEVVAKLDSRDYTAERDRARARRDTAKADYDRYAKAFESNAVTEQQVSRSKGQLDIAAANLRVAAKALEDTELRAPFAGRIARRLVDDFANVQAKEPVLVLQDSSSLELRVNVAERDWVRGDMTVGKEELTRRINPRVEIGSVPGRFLPAYIKEVSNVADPATRTYQVTVGFESPSDFNVSPGMTGRVIADRYTVNRQNQGGGISVPAGAVVADDDNNPFVWLVNAGSMTVSRRTVTLGEVSSGSVSVIDGLSSGDRIAVSGVNSLVDGMPVRELEERR
jgi:RND family efflux transporter MFP subunit